MLLNRHSFLHIKYLYKSREEKILPYSNTNNQIIRFKPYLGMESSNKTTHKVSKGESLYSIAMLYGLNPTTLQEQNNLTNDILEEGLILNLVPNKNMTLLSKNDKSNDNIVIEEQVSIVKSLVHIVKKGETLYSIARTYEISVDQIIDQNNLSNTTIKEGQKLKLSL